MLCDMEIYVLSVFVDPRFVNTLVMVVFTSVFSPLPWHLWILRCPYTNLLCSSLFLPLNHREKQSENGITPYVRCQIAQKHKRGNRTQENINGLLGKQYSEFLCMKMDQNCYLFQFWALIVGCVMPRQPPFQHDFLDRSKKLDKSWLSSSRKITISQRRKQVELSKNYLYKDAIAVYVSYTTAVTILCKNQDSQALALHNLEKFLLSLFSIRHFTFWCIYSPVSYSHVIQHTMTSYETQQKKLLSYLNLILYFLARTSSLLT